MTSSRAVALHRVGTRAVLVDLDGLDDVMTWHAALVADPLPGQCDVIAAAATLLVRFGSPADARRGLGVLDDFAPGPAASATGREIVLDVVYDGADLDPLARMLGTTAEALVARHSEEIWTAAFGGFAPGFSYCAPSGTGWDVPRRESPRTAVPAGSVALAGGFSAVYPRQSPGGWQLIGRTDALLWDETADPPALIAPGDVVRYRPVRASASVAEDADTAPRAENAGDTGDAGSARAPDAPGRPALEVLDAGLQTVLEDRGRPGRGDLGVAPSGVVDRASAGAANSVVGNAAGAAVLENVGGLRLRALVDLVVAVTGADAPAVRTVRAPASAGAPAGSPAAASAETPAAEPTAAAPGSHRPVELGRATLLRAGADLVVAAPRRGLRSYVAVRGGLAARAVLGSAATDLLSGLGPGPVRQRDVLRVATRDAATGPGPAVAAPTPNPLRLDGAEARLRCVLGPRHDWFPAAEVARFTSLSWQVTGQSNRIGLRLAPPAGTEPLARSRDGELPSEGMVPGSVQVPPNGEPVVFLADHPVTGGYPVIAVVIAEDLDLAGQLPPGAPVRFEPVDATTLQPAVTADGAEHAEEAP